MYTNQTAALRAAAILVEALPEGTTFGVEVTDADTRDDPGVLNIYTKSLEERDRVILRLGIQHAESTDKVANFISYRLGALLVSLVVEENL